MTRNSDTTGDRADETRTGAEGASLSAGEYLAYRLKNRGLDQSQLAEMTGVSRQTINAVVRGRQPISRAMSTKLGLLFDEPADFWLREQFRRATRKISEDADRPDDRDHRPSTLSPAQHQHPALSKILTDAEIHRAVQNAVITIDPYLDANVNAASLDLCLGSVDAFGRQSADQRDASRTIEIAPLECVHAWTRETIGLPDNMTARVGPMARFSHLGLFLGHGLQVDPGFEGQLAFSLFNASPNPIFLSVGEAILSLELIDLGTPSSRPMDGGFASSDFAEKAVRQFADTNPYDRVTQHLRQHMETVDQEGAGSHISRIRNSDIEAESDDRALSQKACLETCFRIIRDEADAEARHRRRRGRWEALETILGDMKLRPDDMEALLKDASIVDQENGSATILRPDRRRLTIPYPDTSISVRVRQLSSPMHLDVSAFMIIQYLISGGRGFSLFADDE